MSTPSSTEALRDPAADQHMTAGRNAFGADQWSDACQQFSAALALGHPEAKAWLTNSKAKLRIHEKKQRQQQDESERQRDDAAERKIEAAQNRMVQVTIGGKTVGVPMSRLRESIPTAGAYGDARTRSGDREKKTISTDKERGDEDDDVEIDFVRRKPLVAAAPTADLSSPPTVPSRLADKTRFASYQTAEEFTLDFFVKDTHRDDVSINIYYPADKSEYSREFKLASKIDHEASVVRHGAIKIEIVLRKWRAGTWPALERTETSLPVDVDERERKVVAEAAAAAAVVERPHVIADVPPSYPTSCRKKRDWDGLSLEAKREEENEKKDGDAGLQHLFQSIYAGGDEDSRRAMVKSYQTSGGTVLSTNWKEVATKDYEKEIEAPKGQEVRRWNS